MWRSTPPNAPAKTAPPSPRPLRGYDRLERVLVGDRRCRARRVRGELDQRRLRAPAHERAQLGGGRRALVGKREVGRETAAFVLGQVGGDAVEDLEVVGGPRERLADLVDPL